MTPYKWTRGFMSIDPEALPTGPNKWCCQKTKLLTIIVNKHLCRNAKKKKKKLKQ